MNVREEQRIDVRVRVMQLIQAALCMGVVTFLGVVLYLKAINPPPERGDAPPVVSLVAAFFFVTATPLAFFLPRLLTGQTVRRLATSDPTTWEPSTLEQRHMEEALSPEERAFALNETGRLLTARQMAGIVGAALHEGPAFAGLIGYMVEGHWLGLAVALAGLGLLVLRFPTGGGVRAWLEEQRQAVAEMKRQGPGRAEGRPG